MPCTSNAPLAIMARRFMRSFCFVLSSAWLCTSIAAAAQPAASAVLHIYFVDTEGGQATLFVFPNHESLLVDTGFPSRGEARDAPRIAAAAKQAGITKIDYVFLTHYHLDHVGGLPELIERIPVGTFIDHGENIEPNIAVTANAYAAYQKILQTGSYKHKTVRAGDTLTIGGSKLTIVSSDNKVLDKPLPGAGKPNPTCAAADRPPANELEPENPYSAGFVLDFGKVRILDTGDLTWINERPLVCPDNKIGHIHLWVVPNHGTDLNSSPVFIDGIAPQVAVMDNGERKGGSTAVLDRIRNASSKPDLWQLHSSMLGGTEHNTDPAQTANLLSPAGAEAAKAAAAGVTPVRGGPRPPAGPPDEGYMLTVDAYSDGRFTVTNRRNGQSKDYKAN